MSAFLSGYQGAPAYALGLALTLVLAARLTPAHWWRRPTARGVAILGGGSWAIGALLLYCLAAGPGALPGTPARAAMPGNDAPLQQNTGPAPEAGARYRVYRDLNVRSAAGVGAAWLAVVPQGATVTATGRNEGDWWQIRYASAPDGEPGWASSLWLRRVQEQARQD